MSENPSKAASLHMLQAFAQYLDNGGSNATITFYSGTRPASLNITANTNDALVTCNFPSPCIKSVEVDYIELEPTDAGMVLKSGTTTWARIYTASGAAVLDLDVGEEITINDDQLLEGTTLLLNSIKLRPPL